MYMNDRKYIFGKFLKDIRNKRNLSQERLAELSFINIKTISNMENAKVNFDLDNLDRLSSILSVDLIEKYFEIMYEDSSNIENIISSLNSKDRYEGKDQSLEINELIRIKERTSRDVVKIKALKLILFFRSMEVKGNPALRKNLIIKALNAGGKFDFNDLNNNYYDNIDYRILMNYATCLDDQQEKLRICKFIEESDVLDNNVRAVLYHNISNIYYILEDNQKALEYINMALAYNSDNPKSAVMLYTKSIILMDDKLPYEDYIKEALDISKKTDPDTYNFILHKFKNIKR
ncbi:DNA-binding helix-turn-helix protein [Anaerococcus tetradius ATCC 35098]|uniref:DNA-binding helix-turn-helix protein n=2 Tax=Anaerococcus tetradius TaxID=33036 RepID=C2CIG1_9FIRM|nr:DNA-binding helix-turn-helix protein [Anaerococcus tetradius ATCC 35098]